MAPPPPSRLDWTVEALLYGLLAFMPAAFGAVEAWSELVVCTVTAAATVLAALRSVQTGAWRPASFAGWIAGGCVFMLPAYAAFQAAALPTAVVAAVAPRNAAAYQNEQPSDAELGKSCSVSLSPDATARRARLLVVAAGMFLIGATRRDAAAVQRLLAAIFLIGVGEGALALVQILAHAQKIYWTYDAPGQITAGSFVNYSNFSQFMNLSLGAGVGLWLYHEARAARRDAPPRRDRSAAKRDATPAWELLSTELPRHAWILAGIVVVGLAVLTSMSRNGAVSLAVAALAVGTLLWRRGIVSWRGWALVVAPAAVFGVLVFTALGTVYDRLATLDDKGQIAGRWEMTAGALRAWQAYPVWGVGFDAHAYVFPLYDRGVTAALAEHADNDYAQWMEETGIIGAVVAITLVTAVSVIAVRLMIRGARSSSRIAFGLAIGLVAVAIHSATDFGQRLPAVFSLTALSAGLLLTLARLERRRDDGALVDADRPWKQTVVHGAPVVLLLIGVWSIVVYGAYQAFVAEQWRWASLVAEHRLQAADDAATATDYADLLTAAEQAATWAPRNPEYRFWLNAYRWQLLRQAFAPPAPAESADEAAGAGIVPAEAIEATRQIADDLAASRRLAPTYGQPVALEGELRLFILSEPRGADLIRRAVQLAPYDPAVTLVAGRLAAREGRKDEARQLFEQGVALAPSAFAEAAHVFLVELKMPAWARDMAGDDPSRLDELSRIAASIPAMADFAAEMRAARTASLESRAATKSASATELATLAAIKCAENDDDDAIALYRQALGLNYGQFEWRLELARALARQEQFDQAIHEVRIALRLRPRHTEAEKLLVKWSIAVKPTASPQRDETAPSASAAEGD